MNWKPNNIFKSPYWLVDKVAADKLSFFGKELVVRAQSVVSAYEKIAYQKIYDINEDEEFILPHSQFKENSLLYMFTLLGCKAHTESLIKVINTTPTLKNNINIKEVKKQLQETLLYVMDDYKQIFSCSTRTEDLFNTTLNNSTFYDSLKNLLEKDKHVGAHLLKGIKAGELIMQRTGNKKVSRNYLDIYKTELDNLFGSENFVYLWQKNSYTMIKAYASFAKTWRQEAIGNFDKPNEKSHSIKNKLSDIIQNFGDRMTHKENFDSRYGFKS